MKTFQHYLLYTYFQKIAIYLQFFQVFLAIEDMSLENQTHIFYLGSIISVVGKSTTEIMGLFQCSKKAP